MRGAPLTRPLSTSRRRAEATFQKTKADTIGFATPTIQVPTSMYGGRARPPFPLDSEVIAGLVRTSGATFEEGWMGLSSAYLNPTDSFLGAAEAFSSQRDNKLTFLTAGGSSHGFAPKGDQKKDGEGRAWIPAAYQYISEVLSLSPALNCSVLHYERPKWTFHAKGMWFCDGPSPPSPETLKTVVVGSGNYGSRSENLDMESNCVLQFGSVEGGAAGDASAAVKRTLFDDWKGLREYAQEIKVRPEGESLARRTLFNAVSYFL